MAAHNLFTPASDGLPQMAFGRKRELAFATDAIINANSPHKASFIMPHVESFYRGEIAAAEQRDPNQQWDRYRR